MESLIRNLQDLVGSDFMKNDRLYVVSTVRENNFIKSYRYNFLPSKHRQESSTSMEEEVEGSVCECFQSSEATERLPQRDTATRTIQAARLGPEEAHATSRSLLL